MLLVMLQHILQQCAACLVSSLCSPCILARQLQSTTHQDAGSHAALMHAYDHVPAVASVIHMTQTPIHCHCATTHASICLWPSHTALTILQLQRTPHTFCRLPGPCHLVWQQHAAHTRCHVQLATPQTHACNALINCCSCTHIVRITLIGPLELLRIALN